MRMRFVAILLLLALVSLAGLAVLYLTTQGQEQSAALINGVGRQRMLSQRIALDVMRLAATEEADRRGELGEDIRFHIQQLAKAQRTRDYNALDRAAAAEVDRLRGEPPFALDHAIAEYRRRVALVLDEAEARRLRPESREVAAVVRQANDRLLPAFEALTTIVEQSARRQIDRLRLVGVFGEAFFLVVLAILGLHVMRPLLRRTHAVVTRLETLREEHGAVIEVMTDAILEHDFATGLLVPLNPAARTLLGLEDGGAVSRARVLPDLPDPAGLDPAEWSHRVVKGIGRDGEPRHLDLTVRPAGKGRRILFLRDITARVEAEQQLRALLQALEDSPSAVVITDLDANILYVNRQFSRASGYEKEEALGRKPSLLRSGLTPTSTYKALWAALKRGERWQGEILNRRKSGELFWELVSISPLFDSHGRATRYIAVKEDITGRKHMETDLLEARRRAEKVSHAKSNFLAGLSHELRTPLNAVVGFSDVMRAEVFGPLGHDNYRSYIQGIHESGLHLLHLINDVLDLSKVEAGRLELREDEVDVREIVGSVVRLLSDRARQDGVRLANGMEASLPRVRADGLRLRQVLLNLVSNAIKFTPRGGTVMLQGSVTPEGAMALSVRDDGVGIAAKDMASIFEPFAQARNIMVSNEEGAGLGLPLSRRLVELHDGRLTLESEPGRGTQATVVLPPERVILAAGTDAEVHGAPSADAASGDD